MDEILSQARTIAGAMWHRRWIGLAVAWLVAAAGAVVLLRMPDRYEATARVYVDTQTVLKPLMAGLAVQPNIDEQIGMLARTIIARPNIEKIMHSANLDVSATSQIQRDQMVDDLTKRIRFTGSGRENIYTITYQDTSPERSKRVVQDLLSLFVESGLGNKRRDGETARRFIDEQIKGYEQKLSEAENRLKEFKLKNLGFTGAAGGDYFARMSLLSEQAAKVRLELRAAEQARDAYRRELSGEDPVMLPDMGTATGGQHVRVRRSHRCAAQTARRTAAPIHRRAPRCCCNPPTDRATGRTTEAGSRSASQGRGAISAQTLGVDQPRLSANQDLARGGRGKCCFIACTCR